jgi:hypothetical protein
MEWRQGINVVLVVLKELASWLGWMGKLSFYAFLGPAGLGLDAHWLDVLISLALDGFFPIQLGIKSLTPSWMEVRDGTKLSLTTLLKLPLEQNKLADDVSGYCIQFGAKMFLSEL